MYQGRGKEVKMENLEELRAKKPNLYRVACELSKFKNPYKAADMLLALAGPILKEGTEHERKS